MSAAEAEADVRTTIDTAKLRGASAFQTILDTLAGNTTPVIAAQPP